MMKPLVTARLLLLMRCIAVAQTAHTAHTAYTALAALAARGVRRGSSS
jgi:hypothetical protein